MNEKIEIYKKICSIELINKSWELYDCEGNRLKYPSQKGNFPRSLKTKYYNKRTHDKNISTVWILVGITCGDEKRCVQVGRTKDLVNSLNEIREDIKEFYTQDDGKYAHLKQEYKKIVFYEVDIDKYLVNDTLFKNTYGEPPEDLNLSRAYYFIRAAYVEGKLGATTSASMYHKSSLDEYYYDYYKPVVHNANHS